MNIFKKWWYDYRGYVYTVKSGNFNDPTIWSRPIKEGDTVIVTGGTTLMYDDPYFGISYDKQTIEIKNTAKDDFLTYALDCGFTEKQSELLWQLALNVIPRHDT